MPRSRGGDWLEDEVKSLKFSGVDITVSLLEDEEIAELDIADEAAYCKLNDILFLSFPIKDRDVPLSVQETLDFAKSLLNLLKKGKNVVIHCRQGVGRSGLIAACVLTLNNLSSEAAFEKIETARTCKVPDTEEQRNWVETFSGSV